MTGMFGWDGLFHRGSTERIVECRDRGTTVENDVETCPVCGTREIADHEL